MCAWSVHVCKRVNVCMPPREAVGARVCSCTRGNVHRCACQWAWEAGDMTSAVTRPSWAPGAPALPLPLHHVLLLGLPALPDPTFCGQDSWWPVSAVRKGGQDLGPEGWSQGCVQRRRVWKPLVGFPRCRLGWVLARGGPPAAPASTGGKLGCRAPRTALPAAPSFPSQARPWLCRQRPLVL